MRTTKKTLRYYIIESTPNIHGASHDYGADISVAFRQARTVSARLKTTPTREKNCYTNPIRDGEWWKGIQFVVYDEGYRPDKIVHDFGGDELTPEAVQMGNDEDVVESSHLFVSGSHAILETSKRVSGKFAADYLTWLLNNSFPQTYPVLSFTPIANRDVIEEIQQHGVKSIELNVSTTRGAPLDGTNLYNTLAEESQNLNAESANLELKPARRGWLDSDAAIKLYHADNSSPIPSRLVFVLGNGSRIEKSAFRLQKQVDVPCDASGNAQSFAMFAAMQDVYSEWERDGYIQRQSIVDQPL